MSLTTTMHIPGPDRQTMEITGGALERGTTLFLEFNLPTQRTRIHAEWDANETGDALPFILSINGSKSMRVVGFLGLIFDERAFTSGERKPLEIKELGVLGSFLESLSINPDMRRLAQHPDLAVYSFTKIANWASCVSSFGTIGATVGGGGGLATGGVAGATVGGVVGGVFGSAFGLGFCTTGALLES